MELSVFKLVTRTQPSVTQDIHLLIFCNKYGNMRLTQGKTYLAVVRAPSNSPGKHTGRYCFIMRQRGRRFRVPADVITVALY
jgi:hypothetical protein